MFTGEVHPCKAPALPSRSSATPMFDRLVAEGI
jgi:hypothetical protein